MISVGSTFSVTSARYTDEVKTGALLFTSVMVTSREHRLVIAGTPPTGHYKYIVKMEYPEIYDCVYQFFNTKYYFGHR